MKWSKPWSAGYIVQVGGEMVKGMECGDYCTLRPEGRSGEMVKAMECWEYMYFVT